MSKPGFTLVYTALANSYPREGYWTATTNDGNQDGIGSTPENAMACLINNMVEERYLPASDAQKILLH